MAKVKETEMGLAVLNQLNTLDEFQTILDSGAIPSQIDTPQKLQTIVQTGKELGMSPMVSINSINVIKGRTVIAAAMLGALLKARNIEYKYTKDFETIKNDDGEVTKIETEITFWFFSKLKNTVDSREFSISWAEMERAGYTSKDNWSKYPKNMMRSRCMSYGIKAYFPEIYAGFYTDEEIVDALAEDGEYEVEFDENGQINIQEAEEVKESND